MILGIRLILLITSMHTERQLIIAALLHYLSPFPVIQNAGENVIIGGLDIPNTIDTDVCSKIASLQGDLHVYTDQNPCQNRTEENGNFSYIDYYNTLTDFIRGLKLHVYFPRNNMRLNKEFF